MKPALIQPFSALSSCARVFPRNRVHELLSIWALSVKEFLGVWIRAFVTANRVSLLRRGPRFDANR
jgi:hypothetical protein